MKFGRNVALVCVVASALLILASCTRTESADTAGRVTLRINVDPIGNGLELNQQLAAEFEKNTGIKVELLKGPTDATERLSQYLQYFSAKSADIDIYQVDVIWPGVLAEHLLDLKDEFTTETAEFFEPIIRNNTVDGRLVAIPWFGDAGVLYYRRDLLEKYEFQQPPKTWDELDQMATKIQEGERAAGHAGFWGYVWQGKAYEGLTCNALEWQVSHGGGAIIENGRITVNSPAAVAAFKRAAGWVNRISPPGVTTYQEEEARQLFQQGNAAFMRNWPYAYALANGEGSIVRGNVAVTLIPSGGARHAATLGGWQLAVSRYSKHPQQAIDFIRFLVSRDAQKRRAIHVSLLPSRPDLYDDAEISSAIPFLHSMKDVFINAVPRPSTAVGEPYNEFSTEYFQAVHHVLTGQATAEKAMADLEKTLQGLLR